MFADYGRATVHWLSPAASGAVLARGVSLTVQVTGFKIGTAPTDDGFVRLTFVGGTGCSAVDLTSDPTGQGTPGVVLPLSCTGTNLQMTATLHDRATGVALVPPVSETVTVTLQ